MSETQYIHGTHAAEQERLAGLNRLVNPAYLSFLQLDGATSILEVGSGLGLLTREVAQLVPSAEVIGVEYSAEQLARAEPTLPNLRYQQGDAHRLDFDNDRFDVVYCRWVLEHVADPLRVVREMRRVVRPGGRIFLFENDTAMQFFDPPMPRFERVWSQLSVLQQRFGGDSLIGRRLFRLLKHAGFDEIQLSLGNEVYHSGMPAFSVWVKNEAAIVEGCSRAMISHGLATPEDIEISLREIREFEQRDDATSWFSWNRAAAVK